MIDSTDVVIVGSGPVGAAVARELRRLSPDASIAMIEAGPRLPSRPGGHLLSSGDEDERRDYLTRSRAAVQTKYVDGSESAERETRGGFPVGVSRASRFGIETSSFPGAALAWNVGGLGIHWTGACPRPFGPEIPLDDVAHWESLIVAAEEALNVCPAPFPTSPTGERVRMILNELFPTELLHRRPREMPMAGRHDARGFFHRTGPADVFPGIAGGDALFRLFADTVCARLVERSDGAVDIHLRATQDRRTSVMRASVVVLAADTYRTPQLLHASGIRPPALGRYLNDHVFLVGTSLLPDVGEDPEPADGEPWSGAWWVPAVGEAQPFHGQLMQTRDSVTGQRAIGVAWYVPTTLDSDSRLRFSDDETDALGMPRIRIDHRVSAADHSREQQGKAAQLAVGEALGRFQPEWATRLPMGGSLHATGTVRIGSDPETSVADTDGLVHGTASIYVAGNGAVPTALSCNSTLTAVALGIGTARAVCARLGSSKRGTGGAA